METEDIVVGIDLGTTNSCVSYFYDGTVTIVENVDGGKITPSFVFFTDQEEVIVGDNAKRMATLKAEHGIYGVKRLIGKKYNDTSVKRVAKYCPFTIEANEANDPTIVIHQKNGIIRRTPREISSIILRKLKQDTESKLGRGVNKAVITVPANFNVTQREETLAAAKDAGFTVLKLLNEPTAAALSFYNEFDSSEGRHYLVYDLGGGTFDVAILKKTKNVIDIVGIGGNPYLGGQDLDGLILNHVREELMEKYGFDPESGKRSDIVIRRLYSKCENAKKELSTLVDTEIRLHGLVDDHPTAVITLTRNQFEMMAHKLFEETINIVDHCLKECNLPKDAIKEVILVGGSTRIPKIQSMIADYFKRRTLNKFLNPDECVAEGAALQAAMLSKNVHQKINTVKLIDVVPLSLGVADFVHRMHFVIRRNTKIPISNTITHVTSEPNQRGMHFKIYEGERLNAKKNRLLGAFTISDITPAPLGMCAVTLTMSVDDNGILTVTAKETYRNNVKELKVNYVKGDKSTIEIVNFIRDAEENKKEDAKFEIFAKRKGYLLLYCNTVLHNLERKGMVATYKEVYDLCRRTKLEITEMDVDDEERLKRSVQKVESNCKEIVNLHKFEDMPLLEVE